MLLVIMANYMPPLVLIPAHGVVQFGSNIFRSLIHFRHLKRRIVALYLLGGTIGAAIGSQVVVKIPTEYFKTIIAVFIVTITWMPKFKKVPRIPGKFFFLGMISTGLSLVVGAMGPFLAPFFLREGLSKHEIVANKAGCQTFTHCLKLGAYLFIGFAIGQYFWLLVTMVALTFFGNWCGKFLLIKLPEKSFKWIFRILITALAARLLIKAYL